MIADAGNIAFNIYAVLSTLFALEYGTDTFVKHTALVATRIVISPVLVALFTASAEWEEVRSGVSPLALRGLIIAHD